MGGGGQSTKRYSRKGNQMKKILPCQLILKNIDAMASKKSYKEFDNEKKFLRLENSPPTRITFLIMVCP